MMIGGPKAYAAPAPPLPGPLERSDEAADGGALWFALTVEAEAVEDLVGEAAAAEPAALDLVASDLAAAEARDPAAAGPLLPFLSYKGFQAMGWALPQSRSDRFSAFP